ncbi:cytochrome P450 83B1-like [Apium graveolens]|uniref:cytochrome P450 83B1-like n=1 Tax=Apium graveolens TaxID=4045 RepID=UPI003D7904B0
MGRLIDNLNGAWTRLEKSFSETDTFYQQLIDEHIRTSTVTSTEDCSSILDILLQMKKESSDFTFDHIKAILMLEYLLSKCVLKNLLFLRYAHNFIVAATDTTTAAAVWVMTLLIKNPVSMKKVQQELRDFARGKRYLDENEIQQLVYLKAVVEAMRMQPPAPLLHRETIEKCELSDYDIEAKTCVYINTYAIGRDPECWENPDEFSPERFMNSNIDFRGHDYELIPFGSGRRICPGISMGATTTELVVANLLYSFNWKLPPGTSREDIDMATLPGLTFHKKNPLCLIPEIID